MKVFVTVLILLALVAGIYYFSTVAGKEKSPEVVPIDLGEVAGPLKIAVVTWVNHGPFYLAQEKRFYEKRGVSVKINRIEDIGAQKIALQSGRLDGTISSVDFFATAAAEGVPARTVLKLGAGDGADAVLGDISIKEPSDLRGKRIAVEKGSPSHFFLLIVLDEAGLTSEDVELVFMTAGDAGAAFASKNVDACVTWEPWVSTATSQRESTVLATSRDRFGYLVDIFVFRDDVIQGRRSDVEAFVLAWFDAIDYWKANPEESNQVMADALGVPIADFEAMLSGVRLSDLEDNLDYFGLAGGSGKYWEVFDAANEVYGREGLIETPKAPRFVTDTSFIESAAEAFGVEEQKAAG